MQSGHVNSNIGGLEQILNFFRIGIEPGTVNVDVTREYPVNHCTKCTGYDFGVPFLTNRLTKVSLLSLKKKGRGFVSIFTSHS